MSLTQIQWSRVVRGAVRPVPPQRRRGLYVQVPDEEERGGKRPYGVPGQPSPALEKKRYF